MDRRTLAALGLAIGGVSQLGYGVLLGGADFFALISFAEGAGLLLAAAAVMRTPTLPGPWLVAGLTLAAVAALPWFTTLASFDGVGPIASVLNNTGSVVAAIGAIAWTLAAVSPTLAANAVRAGLGFQALGSVVRLPGYNGPTEWLVAFSLAFVGFALATYAFPPAEPKPAERAAGAAERLSRKVP